MLWLWKRRRAFAFAVPGVSWMDDWAPSHTGHVLEVEVVNKEQWSRWVVSHSWHSFEHCNSWPFDCFWYRNWTIFTIYSVRSDLNGTHFLPNNSYMLWYLLSLNHWMDFCQNIDGIQWPKEGKLDPVLILFLNVWQYVHFPTLEGYSSQTWPLSRPIYFSWGSPHLAFDSVLLHISTNLPTGQNYFYLDTQKQLSFSCSWSNLSRNSRNLHAVLRQNRGWMARSWVSELNCNLPHRFSKVYRRRKWWEWGPIAATSISMRMDHML